MAKSEISYSPHTSSKSAISMPNLEMLRMKERPVKDKINQPPYNYFMGRRKVLQRA
tara:strand:- start:1853 stop:2020 length:168 start_codon:yes stop_codon:yes gene_type:complete